MDQQRSMLAAVTAIVLAFALTGCEQQKKEEASVNTETKSGDVNNSVLHARAVEAVIWGMPAVNYDLMLQEMLTKTSGKVGQVIY